MERRLNREDLSKSSPLVASGTHQHGFLWFVYDKYDVIEIDGEEPYIKGTSGPKNTYEFRKTLEAMPSTMYEVPVDLLGPTDPSMFGLGYSRESKRRVGNFGHHYEPLIDTPYLFREFARLHESKHVEEAILDWVHMYGLLGLHKVEPGNLEINVTGDPVPVRYEKEYSQQGGPLETLASIRTEVSKANLVLASYEAALSRDLEKLKTLVAEDMNDMQLEFEDVKDYMESVLMLTRGATYADVLIDWVMFNVVSNVQEVLQDYTFPSIAHQTSRSERPPLHELWSPDVLIRSLYPRNLLGAMYLQFYWLITSTGELSRCKQCGKIIPHSPPIPGTGRKRKTHKNKEFCDDRCRQNYHYHNRIKPKRNAERNGRND